MTTKGTPSSRVVDELRPEYEFDYASSAPNRFAKALAGTTMVVLQPDVAEVFQSGQAVNDLLRSAIVATGARTARRSTGSHRARGRQAK